MRKPNSLNPADLVVLRQWIWARLCGFAGAAEARVCLQLIFPLSLAGY